MKNKKSSKPRSFNKISLLVLLVILVAFVIVFPIINKQSENKNIKDNFSSRDQSLELGNFLISVDKLKTVYSENNSQLEVKTSKIIEKKKADNVHEEGECISVENIYTLFYKRKLKESELFSTNLSWNSFIKDKLKFKNDEIKSRFESLENNLEELFILADGDILQANVGSFNVSSLNYCSGGWFYPVYKETISNTKFNRVVYVEVNTGNGDATSLPNKYLVVNHQENWLLFSESPGWNSDSYMSNDLAKCIKQNSTLKKDVKCVTQVWNKHRSRESVQQWTDEVLSSVEFLKQ